LDCLTRSSSDKKSGNYNTISQYYDDEFTQQNLRGSPFSNLHNHGSLASSNVVANLKMSVSEIGGVGALDVYDLDKQGLSKATLQLDTSFLTAVQYNPLFTGIDQACNNITAVGAEDLGQGALGLITTNIVLSSEIARYVPGAYIRVSRSIAGGVLTTLITQIDTVTNNGGRLTVTTTTSAGAMTAGQVATGIVIVLDPVKCYDITADPTNSRELGTTVGMVTTSTFPYDQQQLYVGQSISVIRSIGGGNLAVVYSNIASITKLAANSLGILTTTSCGAIPATQTVAFISISTNTCTMNLVVEDVNLVAVRHMSKVPSPDGQLFSSWNVEQVNVPAVTQYNHLFEIEPSVISVMALAPTTATNPISLADSLSNYRIRVDDIDQTNRDVECKSSLYYDSLMRTFNNMGSGYQLRNLYPTVGNGVEMAVMTSPVSNSPNTQMLQLSYNNSAAGTEKVLSLYKQVVKKL